MRQILTSRLSLSKHLAHNLGNLLLLGKIGVFHNRRNASSRLLLLISKHLILCIYLVLLKFMRASIKMIGVSNLQSFIASMTQKLTLSDISDESKNYLDKAGITTACLRIKSKWTAGGK